MVVSLLIIRDLVGPSETLPPQLSRFVGLGEADTVEHTAKTAVAMNLKFEIIFQGYCPGSRGGCRCLIFVCIHQDS